jgi:hypothetical protein
LYILTQTTPSTWTLIKETEDDIEELYLKRKEDGSFVCSCLHFSLYHDRMKTYCKHIRMLETNLLNGETEFEA